MIESLCHLWPMTILYFAGASSQFYLADTKRNHSELPNTPCAQVHSLVFIFQQFYHSSFVLQPFWSFSVFLNIVRIGSLFFESHITVVLNHFHKLALSCESQRSKVWWVVAPSEGELVTKHVEIIPESFESACHTCHTCHTCQTCHTCHTFK